MTSALTSLIHRSSGSMAGPWSAASGQADAVATVAVIANDDVNVVTGARMSRVANYVSDLHVRPFIRIPASNNVDDAEPFEDARHRAEHVVGGDGLELLIGQRGYVNTAALETL